MTTDFVSGNSHEWTAFLPHKGTFGENEFSWVGLCDHGSRVSPSRCQQGRVGQSRYASGDHLQQGSGPERAPQ